MSRSSAVLLLAVAAVAAAYARAAGCAAAPSAPLSLAAADQRLVDCNRELRAARLALEAARADLRIAGQRPNPTLTVGASNVNPHAGVGGGALRDKTFDSSLRLEQVVERGGKPQLRIAQAQALLAAAGADIAEQAREQRLAMRTAFFDLAAAQEKVRLQHEFVALADQSAVASERRAQAGEVSQAEANRFRLDAARTANDLRQAQSELQRLRSDFARMIAAEPWAAALEVRVAWPDEVTGAKAGARADIVAARERVAAAEQAAQLARSLATRDITVGVQADRWPVSDTNTQGTGVSYSVGVSIPLQVRHANEGEAARAMADLDAAREALVKAEAGASADAKLADEQLAAARERRQRMDREVAPTARDVAQAAEYAYTRGATGVLDLLDARRSLKSVELDEVQARADAAKAWAAREAAHETIEEGRT